MIIKVGQCIDMIRMRMGADISGDLQSLLLQGFFDHIRICTGIKNNCVVVVAPDQVADFLKIACGDR